MSVAHDCRVSLSHKAITVCHAAIPWARWLGGSAVGGESTTVSRVQKNFMSVHTKWQQKPLHCAYKL